ncbi:MAG: hypothetical protein DMF86_20560 [Acidobacteria bacterium]|nr:MAG: hypothetical protein DMF86_20560 [Acidobacteriota bacterium]
MNVHSVRAGCQGRGSRVHGSRVHGSPVHGFTVHRFTGSWFTTVHGTACAETAAWLPRDIMKNSIAGGFRKNCAWKSRQFSPPNRRPRIFEFCDQIRGSSSSTPANIAEGFARYRPRPFAYCLRTALGELGETQNHLRKGRTKQYLSEDAFARLWRLSKRAFGATTKLHRYLIGCGDNYPDYAHDPPKRTKNPEP